ncbi:MAG: acetyl-CoA carboxylase biotin carboxyl carrier protein subunit [Planctomycetes bacterium]|nr:acetyl-CoA carboxylase biotin carboxyl carrier protein subunit [Planctomycetota bacterium]
MKYYARHGGVTREYTFERRGDQLVAHVDGKALVVDVSVVGDGGVISLVVDGRSHDVIVDQAQGRSLVQVQGERLLIEVEDERERIAHAVGGHKAKGRRTIAAVMPGIVVDVKVAEGEAVQEGQTLMVLEAMKMQNPIQADGPGRIVKLAVKKGEAVSGGALLLELE